MGHLGFKNYLRTITLICVILTVELLAAQTASPSMAEMSKDSLGEKVELRKVARPNRSVNQFYLVGGSILLLVLIMGWIYTYRQMAKKNEEQEKTIKIQSIKIQQEQNQKNKLFTNVAHEFQTPPCIIHGLSNLLFEKEKLTEEGQEGLNILM